ncbi:uncharacterized protein LOC105680693 isoform X1 [Bombus impatiens]|uniref:Uncharacterized protein LOC105680693 isoform X1 n=1 Tax=Bombus impatiens TaxID=132113 RepID=A0A6P6FBP3_BOMIM|nr:uncharacterized protein LOC105680693 isoform X1 [Bombus impatiens]
MPRKSLFFIVLLFSFVLYVENKAIENRNFQSNIANSASRIQDQNINENIDSEVIKSERSNRKINHTTCVGNCNEKKQKFLSESKHICPYESKELCLIFSLSKIAKVQVANLNQPSTHHSLKSNIFDSVSKDARNSKINEEIKEEGQFRLNFVNRNEDKYFQNSLEKQMKSSNVHCRAIHDVYIPEVKQNLPAFACVFGNNTFVLSSERFLQDRRTYLDIKIEENIFKNIKFAPKMSRTNGFDVEKSISQKKADKRLSRNNRVS